MEIPTPTESFMLVTRMRRTGQMNRFLPKLMEEARIAQITLYPLRVELSVSCRVVPVEVPLLE
jgi:hypothetical protein